MNKLSPWHPFTPLYARPFDEVFREFFAPLNDEKKAGTWTPRVDVAETGEAYVIRAELPGLKPEEVEVTLKDKTLTIKGEKTSEQKREGETWHVVERSHGSFQRTFTFPENVDPQSVSAKSEHGLLTVEVRKVPESRPHRIAVKAAE
ncbi:MAG: Hsp20/alpha crystallin family protein [Planctomycetota bacterium]|nr:MAG: Hsp20/alpha crystallin family protein [Planctomycetota bacterium]